jgi:hypothetical protein
MSDNPFICTARSGKHVDYYCLNNRSDEEAETVDWVDSRQPKQPNIESEPSKEGNTIE